MNLASNSARGCQWIITSQTCREEQQQSAHKDVVRNNTVRQAIA